MRIHEISVLKTFAKVTLGLLATIGALAVVLITLAVAAVVTFDPSAQPVANPVVLELDLSQGLVEHVQNDPLSQVLSITRNATTVRQVVLALERASTDDRVVGVITQAGDVRLGLAMIQEVRDAVSNFRATGKFALAYAETFGEFTPGNGAYYLASAFDEIYLQPSGVLNLTGLMYESPFVQGTLHKLGIGIRVARRAEYKNAANVFTEEKYDRHHREAIEALLTAHFGQIIDGIAAGRRLKTAQVEKLIDRAPLSAQEAYHTGLVDALLYRDEVFARLAERTDNVPLLYLHKYFERMRNPYDEGPLVAVIYGVGEIHRGSSRYDAFFGSSSITRAFRQAVVDEAKAIIFRIDSPGGSYVASDLVWRGVMQTRRKGVPVIASMGNVAASGGYFAAVGADHIVAQPGTVTGSIGVLSMKLLTEKFWHDQLGVTWDEVHAGNNATIWSGTQDYNSAQWKQVQNMLDGIYEDFANKVAKGRDLPIAHVKDIARGRVWSGAEALERGLVDKLGGLSTAISLARQTAGLDADTPIRLAVYPPMKEPLEFLLELGDSGENSETDSGIQTDIPEPLSKLLATARQLGFTDRSEVLRMPQLNLVW